MAAIVRKLQRMLDSIEFDDPDDKEDYQETLDEMDDAVDGGQDVSSSAARLERKFDRLIAKAKDKSDSQPKPPGKKGNSSSGSASDKKPEETGKPERTHSASSTWFGA
jgi:hypothetical protein